MFAVLTRYLVVLNTKFKQISLLYINICSFCVAILKFVAIGLQR